MTFDHEIFIRSLLLVILSAPALLLALLGITSLVERPLGERATGRVCVVVNLTGFAASATLLVVMLASGVRHITLDLGNWVAISQYHFSIKLLFDRLTIPFVILTFLLCGTIATFSSKYLHRERGYNRFFVLFSLFLLGMVLAATAGTIEALFAGWEMVGLSSALLVAFFQERPAPARNGLRVWIVYRVSDAALLLAAVVLHHMTSEGDFDKLFGKGPWPEGRASVTEAEALIVGLLLIVAAAGKSALVPFSGWLPRAMEGPTPSSAVFYGALSVHLGAFLLLRAGPILVASPWLAGTVVVLGLATAVYAHLAGSVQADIKSALSFASLAQVGLIVAEIGLGWRYIPLVHLLGHACLRTLQFLRAPTLLHDYHLLENAIGEHLPRKGGGLRARLYRFALERGYLDAILNRFVVAPFVALFQLCDALERRWTNFLSGRSSRESVDRTVATGGIDELP
jgi:NADH-quinone oxidoreductase subunit L